MESPLGWRRRLLFSSILFAFVVFAIELLMQGFYFATAGDFLFRRVMPQLFEEDPTRCYRVLPDLDYTHRTNEFATRIYTNSLGMRTDAARQTPTLPKPDDVYRVLFLGPSFTFGWGSDNEDIYPTLIAQALRVPGKRVEAVNLGTPAQGPTPQLCWLQKQGHQLQPDLIIQTSYGDRVLPVVGECPEVLECPHIVDGRLYTELPSLRRRLIAFAKNSAVVFYGWYAYNALTSETEATDAVGQELYSEATRLDASDLEGLARQYRSYLDLVGDVVGSETEVVFLHIPLSYMVHPADVSRWRHLSDPNPASAVARVGAQVSALRDRGVTIVDSTGGLRESADEERLFYWLDIHLTPEGNRVLTDSVVPAIQGVVDAQLRGSNRDSLQD